MDGRAGRQEARKKTLLAPGAMPGETSRGVGHSRRRRALRLRPSVASPACASEPCSPLPPPTPTPTATPPHRHPHPLPSG